jgi:DNA-binding transcriptional LysR family regulator
MRQLAAWPSRPPIAIGDDGYQKFGYPARNQAWIAVDFRQLTYFLNAVEQRSVSAAARICGAAQPTLSTQIRRLEQELGQSLFIRTASGLQPTQPGHALYRATAPMLHDVAHGVRYLRSGSRQPMTVATIRIDYSAGSLLGTMARAAAHGVESNSPRLKLLLEGSEAAPADRASSGGRTLHIRHALKSRDGVARAHPDSWLLVEVAAAGKDDPLSRRIAAGSVIHVPALPDDVTEAVLHRPGILAPTSLRMHGEEATDLLLQLLSQNRGVALLPRLAMNPALLKHPRLVVEKITRGLPQLVMTIDGASQHAGLRTTFTKEFAQHVKAACVPADRNRGISQLPNTRQLQYFLGAIDEGGMSRAAARFNIVQPALSMQMKSLEAKLGGRLFERSPQGIAPTELGRTAYTIYAPILDQLKRLQRRETPKPHQPVFSVGVMPALDEQSLLVQAVTAAIVEWRQAFPNVTLKSVEALSDTLLDWVADGTVDLAVVDDLHGRTSFASQSLCSEPLVILTSAHDAPCPSGPIRLADVPCLDLVLPSARHGLRALMNRHFASIGVSLVPKLELDSMASAVRLVKSGGWATILPASAVQRSIDDRMLAAHPIVQPTIMRNLRSVRLPHHAAKPWEGPFVGMLRTLLRSASRDYPA